MPQEEPDPIYCDGVQVGCAPFTTALIFSISAAPSKGAQPPDVVADIRMSPEHAKVLAILLRRQLKEFEQQLGKLIPLRPQVTQQLGLSPHEDW